MSRLSEQGSRIFQQTLELSDDERALLVTEIVATLPDPPDQADDDLSPAQLAEIQRRLDDLDRGVTKAIPWSEARLQIEARLAAVRAQRAG
jgi:putative addiction module component (TIGR02574 family)